MQKVRVPVNSFQYGEVSDSLIMRTDTQIYAASAQRVENLLVTAEGAVKKRYGLKHTYDYSLTYDAANPIKSKLTGFMYDDNEQYVVSIEHQKLRFFRLASDGTVPLVATVTTDTLSAALPFDQDYLNEYTTAQYGDVLFVCHPLFAPRLVTRTSLTTFTVSTFSFDSRADGKQIYQPYTSFQSQGVPLDPSATTGTGVTLALSVTSTPDPDGICLLQDPTGAGAIAFTLNGALVSGGSVSLANARTITVTTGGTSNTGRTFTVVGTDQDGISQSEVITGPASNSTVVSTKMFKTISSVTINAGSFALSIGVGEKTAVSYFNTDGSKTGADYLSSAHIGATIKYHDSEILITSVQSATSATGNIIDELKIRLSVLNPLRTTDGSALVEVTHLAHGFEGGEAIVISDAAATGGINTASINGSRTVGNIIDENTYTYTAGASANESTDGGGYVKVVTHAPTLGWSEQAFNAVRGYPAAVALHENRLVFAGTIAQPDTIWMSKIGSFFNFDVDDAADDDAIILTAATGTVNEIRYMVSNRDLQVFAASGELYIPTYLNQAITPTNAQIRKQTPYGTQFVEPASIDGATIFVQHDGYAVREYLYTDTEDAYTSTSVSTLSSHLINDPKSMAVVHAGFALPDSYAFIVSGNGEAAMFSSNRAEKKASWSRVTTNGSFAGVTSVHNRLFVNIYDEYNKLQLCEFTGEIGLDLYLYKPISTNLVDVSDLYSVNQVVDVVVTDGTTTSHLGAFTVTSGEEVDLSAHAGAGYTHAYVGKKFTAKLITNPIDVSGSNGAATGDVRGIASVILDLKDTRSLTVNGRAFSSLAGFNGKKEIRTLGYGRDPQVTIEQADPLPLQVNGLIAELIL